MTWARAALALVAVGAVALVAVSGGSDTDPRTPPGLAGMPPPFLGTAVAGSGGLTAAVDAYGDVVDMRASPVGAALIENPSARQATGTVPEDTGIVPRVSIDGGPALALWQADSVSQRYLPGTNVVRTVARFGAVRAVVTDAARADLFARVLQVRAPAGAATASLAVDVEAGATCLRGGRGRTLALLCSGGESSSREGGGTRGTGRGTVGEARALIADAAGADRRWLALGVGLGADAPFWARQMDARSLLTLRALTDRLTGAVAAGARDGWAYVWPRDAATAALALADSGHRALARRVAHFLDGLDLEASARFDEGGASVPGRGPQGDAAGWVAVARRAAGLPALDATSPWRDLPDYQEGTAGEYLGNAIASGANAAGFETPRGLLRRAGEPGSGLDSAAAWAVRPFPRPALFPAARRTLLGLAADQTRFGITPGSGWTGGADPWSAPTAWTAWSLAALAESAPIPAAARGDRRQALRLIADLRRAATPAGALPERVDAGTGVPRSTTPLAWSHAFAILALRQLWPAP